LTQLQLHGDESGAYCRELKDWNRGVSICKAFLVGEGRPLPAFGEYSDCIDSVLLDTYVKGKDGGTGKTFDWNCVRDLPITRPLILAGGLNPDNIEAAIESARPYAVDVNSGVEDQPGVKNHVLLERLVSGVRRADRLLS